MKRLKTLAIDSSTVNSGWSFMETEGTNIISYKYGNIQPLGSMCLHQRLYYLGNEISKVIEETQPDEIALEESILVTANGFKTARELCRASGIVIYKAYQYQKKSIHLYEPLKWRPLCGLCSIAHKTEIQYHVCKTLGLLDDKQLESYSDHITEINKMIISHTYDDEQQELQKLSKRKIPLDQKKEVKARLSEISELKKKEKKRLKKDWSKAFDALAVDIYSDTGLNTDVTDSFAINFALLNDLGFIVFEKEIRSENKNKKSK